MATFRTPMQAAAANRRQCAAHLDPVRVKAAGSPAEWHSRRCARLAQEAADYCWQHNLYATPQPPEDPPCVPPPHPI